MPRYDTASVPCIARSEAFCTAIAERLLSQSAHKCRAVCPHKELQLAFIPFITSERMRYESLRADKRKTAKPFFNSRLLIRLRAVVVRVASVHRLLPYFCMAKIRSRFAKIRHGLHAVQCENAALCVLIKKCTRRCGVSPQRGKQKRPERLSARTLKRGGDFPPCVRMFAKRD